MHITKISYITPLQQRTLKHANEDKQQSPIECKPKPQIFAYRDFNISFGGRTPEDFYAQDFNRNNMPRTMKDYLDYNYEERQHIPPEQMMKEVFQYLNSAENFDEVKKLYPKEDLFKNLHPNNIKSRKGILAEINTAKALSDKPLLKDGNDDFGMYILKKIYSEGKTLKQINKDFFEKDINDEYKGVITEPINYSTLNAYGIDFPNNSFWHSFINTRDEYKQFFVSLPKDDYIPGVNTGNSSSSSAGKTRSANVSGNTESKPQRRYRLKSENKKRMKNDLANKKSFDVEDVKKTVRRHFSKDDPEASFLIKYMSPIMTIAADRIHLSEEIKYFAELEKDKGKISDEKTMLGRFWKHNPQLAEYYSQTITDTMDYFEDVYGAGGMIPINSDYKPINPKSKTQKPIDYIPHEFLELLNYAQEIEPQRSAQYLEHEKLQQQWEEHFNERYAELKPDGQNISDADNSTQNVAQACSAEELLSQTANSNGAKVYNFNTTAGQSIKVTVNIDEIFSDFINNEIKIFPTKFAKMYSREMTNNPEITEKYKLTLATKRIWSMLDDDQIYSPDELNDKLFYEKYKFFAKHNNESAAAAQAIMSALILNLGDIIPAAFYKLDIFEFKDLIQSNEKGVDLQYAIQLFKDDIDKFYEEYKKPITNSEINKTKLQFMNALDNYDPSISIENSDIQEIILMMKEICSISKKKREALKSLFEIVVEKTPATKSILNKDMDKKYKQAYFENILSNLIKYDFSGESKSFLPSILNREIYDNHKNKLSVKTRFMLEKCINNYISNPKYKSVFEMPCEQLKELDKK